LLFLLATGQLNKVLAFLVRFSFLDFNSVKGNSFGLRGVLFLRVVEFLAFKEKVSLGNFFTAKKATTTLLENVSGWEFVGNLFLLLGGFLDGFLRIFILRYGSGFRGGYSRGITGTFSSSGASTSFGTSFCAGFRSS